MSDVKFNKTFSTSTLLVGERYIEKVGDGRREAETEVECDEGSDGVAVGGEMEERGGGGGTWWRINAGTVGEVGEGGLWLL